MMASWQQWLAKGDVKTHQTSKQEVDNLRALIVVLGVIWRKTLGDKWRNGLLRAATQFGVAKGI